ncbi:MAG: c-type cytochrome [Gemmatimonadota bacterium]
MRTLWKDTVTVAALAALATLGGFAPAAGQESGAQVWGRACGRCHRAQPPNKYSADEWKAVVGHMALNARLTTAEEKAVREFLVGAARPIAVRVTPETSEGPRVTATEAGMAVLDADAVKEEIGENLFKRQCVACHGAKGKGDGPAAAALTPRPTNLTDAKLMSKLTDEELAAIISGGKGSMPAFSKLLTSEQLDAVVRYVRSLSAAKKK